MPKAKKNEPFNPKDLTPQEQLKFEIAQELGNPKTANVVALGYIAKLLPEVPYDIIAAEVEKSFAAKPKLIPINLEALRKGYELNKG